MGVLSSVYFTFLEVDLNIRNFNTICTFIREGDNLFHHWKENNLLQ